MIRPDKNRGAAPEVLSKRLRSGLTEGEHVLEKLAEHLEADKPREKFAFKYDRYKHGEVRKALREMFHGKCAYCEQRYVALQPMDVEHWRPKGLADFGDGFDPNPIGYYWLASTWTNLLPSCIDCNRGRNLIEFGKEGTKPVLMGKKNQFPLKAGSTPVTSHDEERDVDAEQPLLLNPADPDFQPSDHFAYTPEAVMQPKTDQARESIRVYALNRVDLVDERMAYRKVYDHRVGVINELDRLLAGYRGRRERLEVNRALAEDMHAKERAALRDMARSSQPFAGMIRYFLHNELPQLKRVRLLAEEGSPP